MTTDDWLQSHFGAEIFRGGLEALESFLAPQIQKILKSKTQIITVAGTNGKGETSLRLAQLIQEEAKSYKLWTSPHILSVKERFQNQAGLISETKLMNYFQKVQAEKIAAQIELSYYEFLFSVFILWASENESDYLILEVGMGGRLDATVLLPASMVLIPSISRDHQEYLGREYRQILKEKWGIMNRCSDVQCVTSFELKYLQEESKKLMNSNIQHEDLFHLAVLKKSDDFSFRNTLLALWGWNKLNGVNNPISTLRQLAKTKSDQSLPARGEKFIVGEKEFTFFGSHNPDGVRKLVQLLKSNNYTFKEIIISFSTREQKDLQTQLKLMEELGKEKIILTSFLHPKAASAEVLQEIADKEGIRFVKEWENILYTNSTPCLVAGSYYFVGAVQSHLFGTR